MYAIRVSPDAEAHLHCLSARDRRIVIAAIEEQLDHEPLVKTRNRKPMRPNPRAGWELRVRQFRVLYNVDEEHKKVFVVAIAVKAGNRFIIGGEEFEL